MREKRKKETHRPREEGRQTKREKKGDMQNERKRDT